VDEKDFAAGADGQINPAHRPFQGDAVSEGLRDMMALFYDGDVWFLQVGSGRRLPVDTGSNSK
jgi:hypothetical protein